MSTKAFTSYLIEPKAPLIIRSGRPFDDQTGADQARFPPPSTLAGALRTAYALGAGEPLGPQLARLAVAGPLPVRLPAGKAPVLLVPKPADALYFWAEQQGKKVKQLVRAAPSALAAGEGCDLPADGLLPVQLCEPVLGKPAPGPRWWSYSDLLAWRQPDKAAPSYQQLCDNGWLPPEDDIRTHVAIDPHSQAADSGKIFQTAGLNFWQKATPEQGAGPFPAVAIGLVGCMALPINAEPIKAGVITLGGERRLAAISSKDGLWPVAPKALAESIRQAGGLCLTLLTPALFSQGWRPGWLNQQLEGTPPGGTGVTLRLRAAALERWQPHSGWDLAKQQPRAGRKLIPAGATYWFELPGTQDTAAIQQLVQALWLTSICDNTQDQLDGFGLVLPQPWHPA
ncbi:CRISPR-associated protein Cmr3 [Rheinheimera sediminis]|uniref:type III-B CRISPR module-associated Cmr3 family protein n=1 Tax=Rheinheimera sp. YQF-1 TaxID=2499626 RepID=UPI000FD76A51|nr:type III-B CRISPR module-associated Cmr3 family protein [Rheinheimera sp. YQF-1]RVT47825.1 CRISPR-associated protein Cmr3 [Rheinheimera sp. YQF-1]